MEKKENLELYYDLLKKQHEILKDLRDSIRIFEEYFFENLLKEDKMKDKFYLVIDLWKIIKAQEKIIELILSKKNMDDNHFFSILHSQDNFFRELCTYGSLLGDVVAANLSKDNGIIEVFSNKPLKIPIQEVRNKIRENRSNFRASLIEAYRSVYQIITEK